MPIWNAQTGRLVCDRVYQARSFWERTRGLIGRPPLGPGEGLMIHHCQGVHMFFMRYPIDVVFLDARWGVVGCVSDLRPWRMTRFYPRADRALELPAGTVARVGIAVGHRLVQGAAPPAGSGGKEGRPGEALPGPAAGTPTRGGAPGSR